MENPFNPPNEEPLPPAPFAEGEATAPGDIPLPMIEQRFALLASQFRHDNTTDPYAPTAGQPVDVTATTGLKIDVARAEVWYTTDGRWPDETAERLPMAAAEVIWQPRSGYLTQWTAQLPGQPAGTAVRYRIAGWKSGSPTDGPPDHFAQDGQGFWATLDDPSPITTFAYWVEQTPAVEPAWMNDAVIYHIFLDRYHPGTADGRFDHDGDPHGKHGGTLRGVTQTLPYLEQLGITCIWLSPINISPTYHRYDATDYFEIDPILGTNDDLRQLIDDAHGRGMRIILDFVPSHLSWNHPAFLAAKADAAADTTSWFVFTEWPDQYRSFLNMVPSLVSVDTNDPGIRRYLIENAVYWINEFGMDGFRLDHVIGHGFDFWVEFRQALEAAKADVVTIGEVTDSPDAMQRYRGRLTHILDFQLATAFRHGFATGFWSVGQLDRFLTAYDQFMAAGPGQASFLDNHDMNRFLFVAGGDLNRLKMAALCQFTLAPTPVIYYGTEIGLSQAQDKDLAGFGGDHHVRVDMVWDESQWNHDLLAFYRALIRLRHAYPALRRGRRQRLHVSDDTQTLAYQIGSLVVVYNLAAEAQEIHLPALSQRGCQLLLTTGEEPHFTAEGVVLAPQTAVIIEDKEKS